MIGASERDVVLVDGLVSAPALRLLLAPAPAARVPASAAGLRIPAASTTAASALTFPATRVNELVVALDRGEVVGFASGTVIMHPDKPTAFFINEIGVHEEYRRQGIARRLMFRIMELARDRGCEGIWCATEADNAAARGLYAALKARETQGIVVYDWDDAEI